MLKPGDTFGDYRVLRLLGKGGMGSVFLLENAEGAQVAAKILDPESAGDHESRKRFLREAQLALGVKHPNLVEAYDVGEDPKTGLCYILLEYVPGGSLADYLKENGALPIEDAVAVVQAMASVLELAREKGIVHRDIKPANIMFDAEGTPKLADLGIIRRGGEFRDAVSELRLPAFGGRRKRHFKIILAVFLPLLIVIAGSVVLVSRRQSIEAINDLRTRIGRPPVSTDLDPNDVRRFAEKMVDSLLGDADLLRETYGHRPLLVIGDIKDRTSLGFDTTWIVDSIRNKLVRSRMFRFADNTTGSRDAPQLGLHGSLVEMDERINGVIGRHFKLSLVLKDIKAGEYVWADEQEIRKERKKTH